MRRAGGDHWEAVLRLVDKNVGDDRPVDLDHLTDHVVELFGLAGAEADGLESCCSKGSRLAAADKLLSMAEGQYGVADAEAAFGKTAQAADGDQAERKLSNGAMISIGMGLLLGIASMLLRRNGQ